MHADHGDLHSFPTRRSSDLVSAPPFPDGRVIASRNAHPPLGAWDERDRKSTRLNSSHQIISYAVFCLKKKKHTTMQSDYAHAHNSACRPNPWRNADICRAAP